MTRTPTRRNEGPAVTSAATVELPRDLKLPAVARAKSRSKTTTIKPAMASPVKALHARPPTAGGAYSMTKRERGESTTPPTSDALELEIAGRMVKLSRRDARALADKILRALK